MIYNDWLKIAATAFAEGEQGNFEVALALYQQAEEKADPRLKFSPTLNLLRHVEGSEEYLKLIEGQVANIAPTENEVFGLTGEDLSHEEGSARGMKKTAIDEAQLAANLKGYYLRAEHHPQNIQKMEPHLLVMSTGRCGTMGLFNLLQQSQYLTHHQFFYNISHVGRLEQMCQHIEGEYKNTAVSTFWLRTRAAEWLSAVHQDRPIAMVGHHDTIFAPAFAMLHPLSRIIFLRRNPRDVFRSMYAKNQWGDRQLRPVFYRFGGDQPGEWKWKDQNRDIIDQIAWYLKFTDAFSRALGRVMGGRWIEIDADKCFQQDVDEITKMRDFAEIDIPLDDMVDHYGTPYNRKSHKIVASTAHLHKGWNINVEEGMKVFDELYEKM